MDTNELRPAGRHPVNIGHLVMGLALLCMVGIWALFQTDVADGDDIRWLMPIPWVVAGAVGLAVTAFTGQRRYAVRQTGWVGAAATEPTDTPDTPEPAETAEVTETALDLPKYPQTSETRAAPEEKS